MNRFFLHIFLTLIASIPVVQAQNLVYNGSFEEYSECPQGNELNNGQFERAIGWFRPTFGTPDYFHRCNYDINFFHTVGVPENFWGYQEAFHGNAYVGFVPIAWNNDGSFNGSEYIRNKLITPLNPCTIYHFRMHVSLANLSTHGIAQIGVWYTTDNIIFSDEIPIIADPQIFFQGEPIVDTNVWTLFEGIFVAKGFEEYLTIGYFRDNVANDTIFIQDNQFFNAPYYYVDSVSLIEIGTVSEEICEAGEILFPNIITTNNDGQNDYLDASSYFVITDEITIMNRWGNVVTVLTQENPVWDGSTSSGKLCTEGTYFYSFSYQWGTQIKKKADSFNW